MDIRHLELYGGLGDGLRLRHLKWRVDGSDMCTLASVSMGQHDIRRAYIASSATHDASARLKGKYIFI